MPANVADVTRQVAITLGASFLAVALAPCLGVLGRVVLGSGVPGPSERTSPGPFAEATLLTPATPACAIWALIYLGLAGHLVWQWLPQHTSSRRARSIGWLAAVAMVLNGLWLLVVRADWLWLSIVVIVALALDLGLLVQVLTRQPASSTVEAVLVDGTFGVYLGWVSVVTVANITATLTASGLRPGGLVSEVAAVLVLAVTAGFGVIVAARLGGRWAVAAALVWGLGWIAVGRFTGELSSDITGIAGVTAAVAVLAATAVVRASQRPAVAKVESRTSVTGSP
ncbi:MAG: TspO/MBR family protein [Propionicimonas sp.]